MDRYLFQWKVEDYKDLPKGLCLMPGTGSVIIRPDLYKTISYLEACDDFDNIIKCYMPNAKVIGKSFYDRRDRFGCHTNSDPVRRLSIQNPWPENDPANDILSDIFFVDVITYKILELPEFYDYKANTVHPVSIMDPKDLDSIIEVRKTTE